MKKKSICDGKEQEFLAWGSLEQHLVELKLWGFHFRGGTDLILSLFEYLNKKVKMPIYEFYSSETSKIYSFFARSTKHADRIPSCPDGKEYSMKKLVSGFSITGNKKEADGEESPEGMDPNDPFAGMSETQTNAMMQEMEGAIEGMDEDNPDPRQMGNLMRRMCELTGEKMDEPMEEVVRKLEEGMNPDELEDRMGDFMGDESESENPLDSTDKQEATKAKWRRLLKKRLVRDPKLYEFEDFLAQ